MLPVLAIGAAIGLASTAISGYKKANALRQQKKNAWERYLINKDFADTQWAINKGEARSALGIQRDRLREDVKTGGENFNTGMLGQAYGIQDARMNLAGQLGSYDVAQGASGTRGNEASGLVKAYAQDSFDRGLAMQYAQNDQALEGMITGANRGYQDIKREQESWGEGGYRTRLYEAEDERNRRLAELGMQEYDSAIEAAKPGVFDYLGGAFAGASTGLSFYSSWQDAKQYWDRGKKQSNPGGNMGNQFSLIGQQNSFNSIGNNAFGISPQGFYERYGGSGSGLQPELGHYGNSPPRLGPYWRE